MLSTLSREMRTQLVSASSAQYRSRWSVRKSTSVESFNTEMKCIL